MTLSTIGPVTRRDILSRLTDENLMRVLATAKRLIAEGDAIAAVAAEWKHDVLVECAQRIADQIKGR